MKKITKKTLIILGLVLCLGVVSILPGFAVTEADLSKYLLTRKEWNEWINGSGESTGISQKLETMESSMMESVQKYVESYVATLPPLDAEETTKKENVVVNSDINDRLISQSLSLHGGGWYYVPTGSSTAIYVTNATTRFFLKICDVNDGYIGKITVKITWKENNPDAAGTISPVIFRGFSATTENTSNLKETGKVTVPYGGTISDTLTYTTDGTETVLYLYGFTYDSSGPVADVISFALTAE